MNFIELKNWINNLPEEEVKNHNIIFRKYDSLNDEYQYAFDTPITASGVDMDNGEIFLCDEDSYLNMMKNE